MHGRNFAARRGGLRSIAAFAALVLCGCAVQWDLNYDIAANKARTTNKPMLLYFKDWSSPEHRELVVNLFENPTVARELAQTVNCELLHNWGPEAKRYNTLKSPQTFVFCRPDGTEVDRLVVGKAGIAPAKFAEWIRKCRGEVSGSAPPPGPSPPKASGSASSIKPAADAPAASPRPGPPTGEADAAPTQVDVDLVDRTPDSGTDAGSPP